MLKPQRRLSLYLRTEVGHVSKVLKTGVGERGASWWKGKEIWKACTLQRQQPAMLRGGADSGGSGSRNYTSCHGETLSSRLQRWKDHQRFFFCKYTQYIFLVMSTALEACLPASESQLHVSSLTTSSYFNLSASVFSFVNGTHLVQLLRRFSEFCLVWGERLIPTLFILLDPDLLSNTA